MRISFVRFSYAERVKWYKIFIGVYTITSTWVVGKKINLKYYQSKNSDSEFLDPVSSENLFPARKFISKLIFHWNCDYWSLILLGILFFAYGFGTYAFSFVSIGSGCEGVLFAGQYMILGVLLAGSRICINNRGGLGSK